MKTKTIKLLPLKSRISSMLFDYILQADRPVPLSELAELVSSSNHPRQPAQQKLSPSALVNMYLSNLVKNRIDNINPCTNKPGIYVPSQRVLDQIKADTAAKNDTDLGIEIPEPEPEPEPIKWVGQVAAPRQYDVMHAPAYVPPPILCRGGKSIREVLEDHPSRHASYIPAL